MARMLAHKCIAHVHSMNYNSYYIFSCYKFTNESFLCQYSCPCACNSKYTVSAHVNIFISLFMSLLLKLLVLAPVIPISASTHAWILSQFAVFSACLSVPHPEEKQSHTSSINPSWLFQKPSLHITIMITKLRHATML